MKRRGGGVLSEERRERFLKIWKEKGPAVRVKDFQNRAEYHSYKRFIAVHKDELEPSGEFFSFKRLADAVPNWHDLAEVEQKLIQLAFKVAAGRVKGNVSMLKFLLESHIPFYQRAGKEFSPEDYKKVFEDIWGKEQNRDKDKGDKDFEFEVYEDFYKELNNAEG